MAKPAKKTRLHITYPQAQRVRAQLLKNSTPVLSERDREVVLQILRDVYPIKQSSAKRRSPQACQRRPAHRRDLQNRNRK
jgi:hypothetical protein